MVISCNPAEHQRALAWAPRQDLFNLTQRELRTCSASLHDRLVPAWKPSDAQGLTRWRSQLRPTMVSQLWTDVDGSCSDRSISADLDWTKVMTEFLSHLETLKPDPKQKHVMFEEKTTATSVGDNWRKLPHTWSSGLMVVHPTSILSPWIPLVQETIGFVPVPLLAFIPRW